MSGVSKIRQLPKELRDLVNDMLDKGRTVTEIAEALKAAGADVSRGSVGRYRLDWQEGMRDLREVREFAEASVRSLADMPESKTARLNAQLLEGALFKAMMSLRATFESDPEKAIKLITKGAMAQMLLSKATRDDAEKTIKASDFADDKAGGLALAEGDNTIKVEFVHPPKKALPASSETAKQDG
ncbi:MAG TPA: DUF3486 family protein [Bilophila wadsworthia]|uniref:phage protein Gp27 family protein n=1 Tax=Bilophila wadsworthia TaxID=35833 RepID=UPI001E12F027|nr:phage protein Gp27 family protein [Bilophila wadsworthia]HJH14177.1 DUF3486 family protein [Bilophila wadsworthia]